MMNIQRKVDPRSKRTDGALGRFAHNATKSWLGHPNGESGRKVFAPRDPGLPLRTRIRLLTLMHAILLIRCADRPGIVAAVSSFLFRHGANIVDLDQHSTEGENGSGSYFMRLEFQARSVDVPLADLGALFGAEVAAPFGMDWRLSSDAERKRVAVLVSRHDHVLLARTSVFLVHLGERLLELQSNALTHHTGGVDGVDEGIRMSLE